MLKIYNTLTRRKEEFSPIHPGRVGMYSCGPTVYRYAHIGNMRTYLMADWLRRILEARGRQVEHIKNITDVGHMRQEMVERGEDKMIAAALSEGKSLWEIAEFYAGAFHEDEAKLGILPATVFPKATEHVSEMVDITEKLVAGGYAYESQGNVYFDVSKFPAYGQLSRNEQEALLQGVRVEVDPLKRHPSDFTLWKAAEPGRDVKWPSPWGDGFPGWHIECSAMSMKYLGEEIDIHTGGVDNIFPHHEGEIAQSEGATGKRFVRHWVHGQHLLADGVKMAKSTGNSYTISELEDKGFHPLSFRYLCLTAHYRSRLNFTFSSLRAAQRGLARLKERVQGWAASPPTGGEEAGRQRKALWEKVEDDLNMSAALGAFWKMARSGLPEGDKAFLAREFDQVLGLQLFTPLPGKAPTPEVLELVKEREDLRRRKEYQQADELRSRIWSLGFEVRDTAGGTEVVSLEAIGKADNLRGRISSSLEVDFLVDRSPTCDVSINILASADEEDVRRCVQSVLKWCGGHSIEVVALDNGSGVGAGDWLDAMSRQDPRLRVIRSDHTLGWGAGRNVGLRQSLGRYIVLMDTSVEAVGDFLTPVKEALSRSDVGLVGPWGVSTEDMHQFHEAVDSEVDAIQGYMMAFPRSHLKEVGLIDEKYRFYRHADLDYSMAFKAGGYRVVQLFNLPLVRHEHRGWTSVSEEERERLSKKNYYRFLSKWDDRTDLLVSNRG